MSFNYRLKQLRLSNNLTQGELANVLGIRATTIANYESNRNEPSFNKLIRLADHFGVSCDYLLGLSEDCSKCIMRSIHKEQIEIAAMLQQLDQNSLENLKVYMEYLVYKQELMNRTQ